MTRVIAMVAASLLALALTGCGDNDKKEETAAPTETTAPADAQKPADAQPADTQQQQ